MECSVGLPALARLLACSWPLPLSLAFFLPPFLLFLLLLLPHLLLLLVMPLYSTPRMSECRRWERKRGNKWEGRQQTKTKQLRCKTNKNKTSERVCAMQNNAVVECKRTTKENKGKKEYRGLETRLGRQGRRPAGLRASFFKFFPPIRGLWELRNLYKSKTPSIFKIS